MSKRPKFVAGNWKMHTSLAGAKGLAATIVSGLGGDNRVLVAVCPPFPWLAAVADAVKGSGVDVGGQNCHFEKEGAFTGEVAPQMLVEAGCKYVILGHSERRHVLGEEDAFINKKLKAALATSLHPIFCIGETNAQREGDQTESVLEQQLISGLAGLTATEMARVVVAYEPVWAIGTGKVATPEQAQTAHAFIRSRISKMFGENIAASLLILYGGSAKPENVEPLLKQPNVDGALVGAASLKAELFLAIIRAAA